MPEKKEKQIVKETKQPVFSKSKMIYNNGVRPVIIKHNSMSKIVLHPGKSIRLVNKEADAFMKKYDFLALKKDK